VKVNIVIEEKEIEIEMRTAFITNAGREKPISREVAIQSITNLQIKLTQQKVLDRFSEIPFHLVKPEVFQKYMTKKSPHVNWVLEEDKKVLKILPAEKTIRNRFPDVEAEMLIQRRKEIINIIKYREFITECPEVLKKGEKMIELHENMSEEEIDEYVLKCVREGKSDGISVAPDIFKRLKSQIKAIWKEQGIVIPSKPKRKHYTTEEIDRLQKIWNQAPNNSKKR